MFLQSFFLIFFILILIFFREPTNLVRSTQSTEKYKVKKTKQKSQKKTQALHVFIT